MAQKPKTTHAQAVEWVRLAGGIRRAARRHGVPYTTMHHAFHNKMDGARHAKSAIGKQELRGDIKAPQPKTAATPNPGAVSRFILTCAQNNTKVHPAVWQNLLALREHYSAQIMVAQFAYDKGAMGAHGAKPGTASTRETLWYDPLIVPYICNERIELAHGLVWCGELNILPTAVRPLSGLESYTGRRSGIVPHVKIAMESIASGKFEPTKFMYTTGTVTQRNYIQKKAGQKAEFHHCYGALLVEVDDRGAWYCRQLNADSAGTIQDLGVLAKGGKVTTGNRVEAISWGDIHQCRLDPMVASLGWGIGETPKGVMVDALKPRYQFMHDLLDFQSRNHHHAKDPHERYRLHVQRRESVEDEVRGAAQFLQETQRPETQTVVVDSNHDEALARWLREADYRQDPVNARYFLSLQTDVYQHIEQGAELHVLEHAIGVDGVRFLREDESFVICRDGNGGIEMGMHGHLGVNGARGSANAFAKMGRKAVVGHTHSAGIVDGIYTAGVSGSLDLGYNKGPSSWSHSHVVVYPNGKRCIVTMWKGKWRA